MINDNNINNDGDHDAEGNGLLVLELSLLGLKRSQLRIKCTAVLVAARAGPCTLSQCARATADDGSAPRKEGAADADDEPSLG